MCLLDSIPFGFSLLQIENPGIDYIILEKAVETAKYTKHAKSEPIRKDSSLTREVNALLNTVPLLFRVLGVFRGLNCRI